MSDTPGLEEHAPTLHLLSVPEFESLLAVDTALQAVVM